MQFTPQQLAGAQRYTQRTRVGNWLEDMCLEEEKLSEFSRSQENGSLIMNDLYKKQAVYNKRVALSKCADGALRFGDKVMIGNPAAGALLAVDLTESIFESDQGSRLVTASFANMPVARAVFVVLGPGAADRAATNQVPRQHIELIDVELTRTGNVTNYDGSSTGRGFVGSLYAASPAQYARGALPPGTYQKQAVFSNSTPSGRVTYFCTAPPDARTYV